MIPAWLAEATPTDLTWIKQLVDAFGPTAAAFATVAGILFFFYRRDHLAMQETLKEDRDRMIQAVQQVTRAVDISAESQRQAADAFRQGLETMSRAYDDRREDRRRQESR